jgi:hypothetical protein
MNPPPLLQALWVSLPTVETPSLPQVVQGLLLALAAQPQEALQQSQ